MGTHVSPIFIIYIWNNVKQVQDRACACFATHTELSSWFTDDAGYITWLLLLSSQRCRSTRHFKVSKILTWHFIFPFRIFRSIVFHMNAREHHFQRRFSHCGDRWTCHLQGSSICASNYKSGLPNIKTRWQSPSSPHRKQRLQETHSFLARMFALWTFWRLVFDPPYFHDKIISFF